MSMFMIYLSTSVCLYHSWYDFESGLDSLHFVFVQYLVSVFITIYNFTLFLSSHKIFLVFLSFICFCFPFLAHRPFFPFPYSFCCSFGFSFVYAQLFFPFFPSNLQNFPSCFSFPFITFCNRDFSFFSLSLLSFFRHRKQLLPWVFLFLWTAMSSVA